MNPDKIDTSDLDDTQGTARFAARAAMAMKTIGWSEPAALLAVLSDPGAEHQVLATTFELTTKSFSRATAKAQGHGLLVGRAGAWVPVLPTLDGSSAPTDGKDVKKHLAEQLAEARAGLLGFRGVKYLSPLERDVAVVLTGAGARFAYEVPYGSFLTTGRAWTADFVVTVGTQDVKVVVEVTGRADAQATIDEKVGVVEAAGIPIVVVRGPCDLEALVRVISQKARKWLEDSVKPTPPVEPDEVSNRLVGHVTKGGIYVVPAAVRDRSKPEVPYVPLAKRDPLPPLPTPPAIPGLDLADHELRQLAELEEEDDYRFVQVRIQAAREQAQAELATLRASETQEQRVERAVRALAVDHERWRAKYGVAARVARQAREQAQAEAIYGVRPDEGEVELTGEECAEQDELPDDTEAGRSE